MVKAEPTAADQNKLFLKPISHESLLSIRLQYDEGMHAYDTGLFTGDDPLRWYVYLKCEHVINCNRNNT